MVFSSIQAYLDSSNWQQVPSSNYNQINGASTNDANNNHTLHSQPQSQSQPQPQPPCNGTGGGSVRPASMVDRARLANVAIPEAPLKCPRCESTNTKFCYFNNYSLTQPRHFCKTCRRYWTRGGALRNVPVGGGCRRNRRSKSSNNNNNNSGNNNNNGLTASSNASTISAILSSNYGGQHESILSQILSPVRLMGPTCNNFGDIIAGENNYGEFRSNNNGNLEDSLNSASGFYSISSALASQFSAVKVEENHPYKWVNLNGNSSPWADLSTLGDSSR